MLLRYVGSKPLPRILCTPIPYVSHSERIGELQFNPTCDVTNEEWADYLLAECGGAFVCEQPLASLPMTQPVASSFTNTISHVMSGAEASPSHPYAGKQFLGKAGKWNAKAFLKKKNIESVYALHRIPDGWELVPAVPAMLAEGEPSLPAPADGQGELSHANSD